MIEYFDEDNYEPPLSAKKSSKQANGSNHQKAQNHSKKFVPTAENKRSSAKNHHATGSISDGD